MLAYIFPGQGSQFKGMGAELFDDFQLYTDLASDILGYSVKKLCLSDPNDNLGKTQYTQPMLYLVNALTYLHTIKETQKKPDYVAGHSLGEFNALFAAGVFDFETGLRLVQKRGELMSKAGSGGMAAIIGLHPDEIQRVLVENNFDGLSIANYNSPNQNVISGAKSQIYEAEHVFSYMENTRYIPLNTSGAFHSRFMEKAKNEFDQFIDQFEFQSPCIPVFSNYTGLLYQVSDIKTNIVEQITGSVKWIDIVRYMMGLGVNDIVEIGPGKVLTGLVRTITRMCEPLTMPVIPSKKEEVKTEIKERSTSKLGSEEFKKEYGVKHAYVLGAMYKGISSSKMVIRMGKANLLAMFGTGGLSLGDVERELIKIKQELSHQETFGMNLLYHSDNLKEEEQLVDLYIKYGVPVIECSAYVYITPALVRYRLLGITQDDKGQVYSKSRIIAKVSRPEVAEQFLSPAPDNIVEKLLFENLITVNQARLAKHLAMADDICVESDSAGHTDQGVALSLIPAMRQLRDRMQDKFQYTKKVRIGAGGGIGTGEAALACFMLGADFITTGSINQCTVEAGTSDMVKDMLQEVNIQDTQYAPAGDMFELGAKVQVLKKGVFFPARANKLYELYKRYDSIDEIDEKTRKQIEEKYLRKSFSDVYHEIKQFYDSDTIEKAEMNPKFKMALIFKYYFAQVTKAALTGDKERKVDFQIHCGPALGSFNQWVKDTKMQNWRNRHVDQIAEMLMNEAEKKYLEFYNKIENK